MAIFRIMFLACLAFIGAVALFMGGVVMLTSWQNGAIMMSYTVDGQAVSETINRATDSSRFWRIYTLLGIVPAALGAAALAYGVRHLRF